MAYWSKTALAALKVITEAITLLLTHQASYTYNFFFPAQHKP
jgi:hypothetical protein